MALPIAGLSGLTQITEAAKGVAKAVGSENSEFLRTLGGMIEDVGGVQEDAQAKVAELLQGTGQDLHSAMIAVEKADLSFQLMMQVRNKIIQAYQTISQMPF